MSTMKKIFGFLLVLLLTNQVNAQNINAQNTDAVLKFKKFLLIPSSGIFEFVVGTAKFEEENLAKSFFVIDMEITSLKLKDDKSTALWQTEAYLNPIMNPALSFSSEQINKTKDGYAAVGQLKLGQVQVDAVFNFAISEDGVAEGEVKFNRNDLKIGTNLGLIKLSRKGKLELKIELS